MATKKMTHPDSSQTVEVLADEVERYESQGWSVKDSPAEKKSSK